MVCLPFYWGPPTSLGKTDRKSTRLNSSHQINSYAVFCLKKKRGGAGARLALAHRHRRRLQPGDLADPALEPDQGELPQRAVTAGRRGSCFFFNDPATTEIYTLSLHDALPILPPEGKLDASGSPLTNSLPENS